MARRTPASMRTGWTNASPPWTTRWATASSRAASTWSRPATGADVPSAATRWSFRLVEPALRTRTSPTRLERPGPPGDGGMVLAVLARPRAGLMAGCRHRLAQTAGPVAEARHPVDHVHHEVVAVEIVQHHHVERRGRRALLLVPAHVDVAVVRAPVGEAVDQPRVAVVG